MHYFATASLFLCFLSLTSAQAQVAEPELVAELRGAPTQVDRIRALNDSQVRSLLV